MRNIVLNLVLKSCDYGRKTRIYEVDNSSVMSSSWYFAPCLALTME